MEKDLNVKIICKYDKKYERFLGEVFQYVLENYARKLSLERLELIELVDKSKFNIPIDGRTCDGGTKVIVTSRLYELLPSLEIQVLFDNQNFKTLVNTLYHELGHVSDWEKMPKLYEIVEKNDPADLALACLLWIEYVAEKRSCLMGLVNPEEFCDGFVDKEWRVTQFDYEDMSQRNFFYLLKHIPYFMARTLDPYTRKKYLKQMKNPVLAQFILNLDKEIVGLENKSFLTEPERLTGLLGIMDEYYKKLKVDSNSTLSEKL